MLNLTLEERKAQFEKDLGMFNDRVIICKGTGCVANGANDIYHKFYEIRVFTRRFIIFSIF